jgi:predicted nucleic-acid-binding Zn-ribbon protein
MAYKQIQVTEETHAKIVDVAKKNYRGIGDQISLWADTACEHPQDQREQVNIVVAPFIPPDVKKRKTVRVGMNQPYHGFFCNKCGQYVFLGEHKELVAAALNAPLTGVTA